MTEHVCEFRIVRDWTGGIVAKCHTLGCKETLGIMEVNRRLNATDRLSAEDAELARAGYAGSMLVNDLTKRRVVASLKAYSNILED